MTVSTMTASLYANTNLDAEENKGLRGRMIDEINESMEDKFESTIALIYGAKDPNSMEVDMEDPFFSAMKLPTTVVEEMHGKQKDTEE